MRRQKKRSSKMVSSMRQLHDALGKRCTSHIMGTDILRPAKWITQHLPLEKAEPPTPIPTPVPPKEDIDIWTPASEQLMILRNTETLEVMLAGYK